jgi:hypothetical protein
MVFAEGLIKIQAQRESPDRLYRLQRYPVLYNRRILRESEKWLSLSSFPFPDLGLLWIGPPPSAPFEELESYSFLELEYDNIPPSAGQAQKEKRNSKP